MTLQITAEEWQIVEQGLPLPVESPTKKKCVIVQEEVFERLQKLEEEDESDWIFWECEDDTSQS